MLKIIKEIAMEAEGVGGCLCGGDSGGIFGLSAFALGAH